MQRQKLRSVYEVFLFEIALLRQDCDAAHRKPSILQWARENEIINMLRRKGLIDGGSDVVKGVRKGTDRLWFIHIKL